MRIVRCLVILLPFLMLCIQFPFDRSESESAPEYPEKNYVNDIYEPNNTFLQAAQIGEGVIRNLFGTPYEYDHYKFITDSNTITKIWILSKDNYIEANHLGYLSLKLYSDPFSSPIQVSTDFSVSYASTRPETLYLQVYSSYSDSSIPYVLSVQDDTLDENETLNPNGTKENARLINTSKYIGSISTYNDTDWYKVAVQSKEFLIVSVDPESSIMASFTGSSQFPVHPIRSGFKTTFTYLPEIDDTCYLKISAYNNYPVIYEIFTKKESFIDDLYEENDSQEHAKLINTGIIDSLHSIFSDEDWFVFGFDSLSQFDLTVEIFTPTPNVVVTLSSKTSVIDSCASSNQNSMKISSAALPDDTFFIKVQNNLSEMNVQPDIPYSISIVSRSLASLDPLEPNNTKQSGTILSQGKTSSVLNTAHDTDWYKIPLSKDEVLTVKIIDSNDRYPNLGVPNLYTSSRSAYEIGNLSNSLDTTLYTYYSPSDDTGYLSVYKYYEETKIPVTYTVEVQKELLHDDIWEENDIRVYSKPLPTGHTDSLCAVINDTDYYRIRFDSATYFDLILTTSGRTSDFRLSLDSNFSNVQTEPILYRDSIKLSYVASSKSEYFLKVLNNTYGTHTQPILKYSLTMRPVTLSSIDPAEPNDTIINSVPLTSDTLESFIVSQHDIDWLKSL